MIKNTCAIALMFTLLASGGTFAEAPSWDHPVNLAEELSLPTGNQSLLSDVSLLPDADQAVTVSINTAYYPEEIFTPTYSYWHVWIMWPWWHIWWPHHWHHWGPPHPAPHH